MRVNGICELFLLLLGVVVFAIAAAGAYVGVNIGTEVADMPSASDVVRVLRQQQITHVRLFDADARMLRALASTGIQVMVSVTNEQVLGIGESPSVAASWVQNNVAAHVPRTNITAIAVGSEVLTMIPHAAPVLVPAMNNLHKALLASDLNLRVKVSAPQSMDVIVRPFPPSAATFNSTWDSTIYQILRFLKTTDSYLMLNAYPYYGYATGNGIFPLDYALFVPLSPAKRIVDPNTLFHYDSMFDAMVDAAYYSMQALNFSRIPIVVTETGWPWRGGANEPDATLGNAETYSNNLVRRVSNSSGPPSQRRIPTNAYIYELFSEGLKRGPISERNWGVLFPNGTQVYPLSLLANSSSSAAAAAPLFCVAKEGADSDKLRGGLDWACGQGHANCTAVQRGCPCYYPDTLHNHASYAFNDYYQRMHAAGATCDFAGTAITTAADPSYASCVFTPSFNGSSTTRFSPAAFGPVSPMLGSSSMLLPQITCFIAGILFLHLL